MMRTAGILLGSLLMLALFIQLLNPGSAPGPVASGTDTEIPVQVASHVSADPAELPAGHGEVVTGVPAAGTTGSDPEDGPGEEAGPVTGNSGLMLDAQAWNEAIRASETAPVADSADLSGYPVWTAFRSQWAADGFARRLTRATDVPVAVVHEAPGDYRVGVRYRHEDERLAMIRQSEAVTGRELEP